MAINLRFDTEEIAYLTVEGEFKVDEAIDSVRELYLDPRFKEPTRLLWDFRAIRVDLSTAEIERYADFVRKNRTQGRGRVAVVVTDDLSYGLSRMYDGLVYGISVEFQAFRDCDEAISWLGEDF